MSKTPIGETLQLLWRLFLWFVMTIYYILESIVNFFIPDRCKKKEIRGNIALVTGGGSGIGRLMCMKLAAKGAIIVTWDVVEAGNKETARLVQAAGGKCHAYTVDLCDRNAIYAAAAKVKQEVGKVDILINNAGVVTGKTFMESPDDSIMRTFQVNAISLCWTAKAFLGDMLSRNKGHIVTVASMAGKLPRAYLVDYCASKYSAVGFHESLTSELKYLGKTGVKTTVVCPIVINTGMFKGANARFFTQLEPSWVADKIVRAIQLNMTTLHLPKYIWFMLLPKLFLPEKSQDFLGKSLESGAMMETFVGRKKGN